MEIKLYLILYGSGSRLSLTCSFYCRPQSVKTALICFICKANCCFCPHFSWNPDVQNSQNDAQLAMFGLVFREIVTWTLLCDSVFWLCHRKIHILSQITGWYDVGSQEENILYLEISTERDFWFLWKGEGVCVCVGRCFKGNASGK